MRRTPLVLLLLLAAALPARAQETPASAPASAGNPDRAPILVNPGLIQKDADDLRDAVASPSVDDFNVHGKAASFFDDIQSKTPSARATGSIQRVVVPGTVGVIDGDSDGMMETGQREYDHYRLTTREVPPEGLDKAMAYAKVMRDHGRADFEHDGKMAGNDMGVFRYSLADASDAGRIELNSVLALISARIGPAFCYTTLVHEAAHALARLEGRLSPKRVIDGELEAYRAQYQMLDILMPSPWPTIVLTSTLELYLEKHPDDQATRSSISFLKFQLALWDTRGDDDKIRDLIKRLGYEESDGKHEGGLNPAATPLRA